MVLKRRLDYGFNGFQVPFIPRAPRSVRRRGLSKKADEDGQVCAIELLASLAGKLLQESESSASSNASEGNHSPAFGQGGVYQESQGEAKPSVAAGGCANSTFMTEVVSRNTSLARAETDAILEHTSVTNCADWCKKIEPDFKSEICKWEDKVGLYSSRLAEAPQNFRESCNNGNIKDCIKQEQEAGSSGIEGPSFTNKCSLKDPLELCANSCSLINSDSKVKSPFCKGTFPNSSFSRYGNVSKLGFRDDDENFIRCNKISTKSKAYRPPQRIAHRRIRKLLTSKYWKVAPKLKDYELSRSDMGVKPLYRKRKTCYSLERGQQRDTLCKKRKFSNRGLDLTSDVGFSSESVSNSLEKGTEGDNLSSSSKQHLLKDSHVKFSIKSFKIPELYIEVPETATVGSLKRTVMEAVMAVLGGEVHVGVLLQGKKVRDDNRTIWQTGLSCEENMDTLSFTLEPSTIQDSPSVCVGDPSSQYETSHSIRSPRTPVLDSGTTDVLHDSPSLTNTGNLVENNTESVSSPTDRMTDKITPDSKALVAVPARSTEPLAVVPVSQKSRRSELVQRRTRRPFSVSEVEALVQAVEELGTGRWRDVKLLAFENADHRTYVDLKDKWKTLVHTAKISAQQRRGEPVPQELLDRVLAAHAFWSQNQTKHQNQHGKHQTPTIKTSPPQTIIEPNLTM